MNKKLLSLLFFVSVMIFQSLGSKAQCTGQVLDSITTYSTLSITGGAAGSVTTNGTGIMGGQRDFQILSSATGGSVAWEMGTAAFPANTFALSPTSGHSFDNGVVMTWDGADDASAATLDAVTGLGGVNMAGSGNFGFTISGADPVSLGQTVTYKFRVYSSPTAYSEGTYSAVGPWSVGAGVNVSIPVSSFVTGAGASGPANFYSVRAVQLFISGNVTAYDLQISNNFTAPCPDVPAITATAGACSGTTNKYTLSGSVTWASMPSTGQMIINVPGEGTVIKNAPFTSPVAYSMNYLNSDGASKTVNVSFTASPVTSSITYTAPVACVGGTCSSGVLGSETHTYTIPLGITEFEDVATSLPKFNTMGGTRTLQKVLLVQKSGFITNVLSENKAITPQTAKVNGSVDGFVQWGDFATGTTLISSSLTQNSINQNYPAGIIVSAGGTPGYSGDVLLPPTFTVYSTFEGMKAYSPNWQNDMASFTDPRLNSNWVTNLTGNAADDDDIIYIPGYLINATNTSVVTSSLSSYTGTGNLPITVSTLSGTSVVGGGGNIDIAIKTKYTTTVSVTYYYCAAPTVTCTDRIDSFTTEQGPASAITTLTTYSSSVTSSTGILGGERDMLVDNMSGTLPYNFAPYAGLSGLAMSHGGGEKSLMTIQWDGADASSTLNPTGLGGINFSTIPSIKFHWVSDPTTPSVPITIELWSSSGEASSLTKTLSSAASMDTTLEFYLNDFTAFVGSGVNMSNIGAVVLKVDATGIGGLDFVIDTMRFGCTPGVTASASACSGTDNTYTVSGTISGGLPPRGDITISVPGEGTVIFNAPFTSPLSYSIPGLNADGASKTVSIQYSNYPLLNTTTTFTAPASCITNSCTSPAISGTEVYTSNIPLRTTTITNVPFNIPKFDDMGGTRVLQKVLISSKQTTQLGSVVESGDATRVPIEANISFSNVIKFSATTFATIANSYIINSDTLSASVSVPVGAHGSSWTGDILGSTLLGMSIAVNNALNAGTDPRLSSGWVSNITGFASDATDIAVFSSAYSGTSNTLVSSGLSSYTGTGNLPFTFSASGSSSFSGSGVLNANSKVKATADLTVTYFYCSVPLASLGNKVWRDDDKDGIQDAGEPGVAGVSVTLYKGTSVIGTTTTDAYGNYLFTNLAPGTDYTIKVTPPANYSFTTQGTPGASGAGTATDCDVDASGISDAINLTSGMNQLDVDAGLIFTAPTLSSIGDKVWLDADADGVQDAGEDGVSGVTVTLYKETSSGSGVYVPYMTTTTNGSGNYLFNNLPNNTNYKVGVTPLPNTKLTSSTGTTTGAATTNSDVDPSTRISGVINVPLAGANYTGIDAGLISDTKSSLGDRMWNDVNNNGVQDAGEQGIPGVVMTLYKETSVGSGTYTSIATTTTDANGKYIFTDLDPAKYKVSATLPSGYSVSSVDAGTDDFADNDFSVTATPTSGEYDLLANQDYAGVDYGIHNSTSGLGSIGDKVWLDTDADGVQDLGEIGQAGITVRLLDGSGNPVNNPATGMPYVLVTDANGNYKFVDLPAGTYKVSFSNLPVNTQFSPTGAGTTSTDNDADASGTTAAITLSSGANITDIDAGISPYAASGLGSIGDRVWVDANNDGIQNAGEQGIGGVTVTLYQSDGTTVIATTTTNPSGGYSFDGLSAGNYVVGFSGFPSGYALQSGKNDLGGNDLLDSDPNPATGKTAIISLGSGEDNTSVDAGIYNTTATNSIGDKVWIDTNNDGLQTTGEPSLSGITVNLINSSGVIVSSVLTDANGNYSFKNLPNGDYSVEVSLPTGLSFTTQNQGSLAQIDSNSKVFPTFGTTPWVTLSGGTNVINLDAGLVTTKALLGDRVWNDVDGNGIQDPGESGIAGVTVTLYASDGTTVITSTVTDANGNYLFTNLDAGNYIVGFSTIPNGLGFSPKNASGSTAANGSDANVTTGKTDAITLAAGDINMNVDAGLTPVLLGGISGVVWFDGLAGDFNRGTSEPLIPGVTVTLKDNLGNIVGTTLSDGTGAYKFTNLPEGTGYTVTFSNYSGTLVPQTTGTATGSDPNPGTGITPSITVIGGAITPNIDAGFDIFAPLPVTLVKFGATSQQCKVFIKWETGVESMVKQYVVRRSSNGVNYTTVASINPKGSNSTYSVEDVKPNKGDNYYRLDIVDISSSITVSPVAKVNVNCAQSVSINVYPNPTTGLVNISGLSGSPTIVKVLNLQGQVIKIINTTNTNETIDLKAFPSANYMLQVLENDIIKLNVTVERL